ncbi:MAG: amino acid adenylation domain-containing protein, partial [Desulfarculaceae bacterium]
RRRFPSRPALWVNKEVYTYDQLALRAGGLAQAILSSEDQAQPLAAVLGYRSLTAYAGVLGILAAGKGYVPLHPGFPAERTRRMLSLSGVKTVIVGSEGVEVLKDVLAGFEERLTLIFPDAEDPSDLKAIFAGHRVLAGSDYKVEQEPGHDPEVPPQNVAYLLFTSGSTGLPKGVPVSQGNACAYVNYIRRRYQVTEQDRFSQTFDLTFDLSVHDLFVCWSSGSCLYCLPKRSLMGPGKFIRDHELTMWFSVPSVIMFMAQMRMLKPGLFPSLRYSLFCGEPLPAKSAALWQQAAPQAVLDNLYGPTEATIAISYYRWDPEKSPQEAVMGVVPIGWIFPEQEGLVADEKGNAVTLGDSGELLLAGTQVTGGYWNNPEKTAAQFVRLPADPQKLWYRTGDLVRQGDDGCLYYLGRIDNQVQVHGHRVELQEIDQALRQAGQSDLAVSVAWPVASPNVEAIYGFICTTASLDEGEVIKRCASTLPDYMVPKKVFFISDMPLNVNGKIDRKALGHRLEEMLDG